MKRLVTILPTSLVYFLLSDLIASTSTQLERPSMILPNISCEDGTRHPNVTFTTMFYNPGAYYNFKPELECYTYKDDSVEILTCRFGGSPLKNGTYSLVEDFILDGCDEVATNESRNVGKTDCQVILKLYHIKEEKQIPIYGNCTFAGDAIDYEQNNSTGSDGYAKLNVALIAVVTPLALVGGLAIVGLSLCILNARLNRNKISKKCVRDAINNITLIELDNMSSDTGTIIQDWTEFSEKDNKKEQDTLSSLAQDQNKESENVKVPISPIGYICIGSMSMN